MPFAPVSMKARLWWRALNALLAVVHTQRQRVAAALDELHAEKAGGVRCPLIEIGGTDADIAERLQMHRGFS